MANFDFNALRQELLNKNIKWQIKENWVLNFDDNQLKQMLGVQVDFNEVKRLNQLNESINFPINKNLFINPPTEITASASLPTKVDWRNFGGKNYISPIKNQGGCGSCVSFCTVALTEAMAAIEKGKFFLDLSEADLHFCSPHGANCGGWWPSSALDSMKARGTVSEADFPYNAAFSGGVHCINVPNHDAKATKITKWQALNSMADRKAWLANVGPLSAVFHVYNDFFAYASGVYSHVSGAEAGYHCVEIIGYSDIENCWICKNSWGDSWGDNGFFKIAYGQCGIDITSNDKNSGGDVIRFPMWTAQGVILPASAAPKIKAISSAINSDGRLEVFSTALDNGVWTAYQTVPHSGPWSSMVSLGGLVKQLVSICNADGRLEVFGIGMDDALWHNFQTKPHSGPWSGWSSLGGKVKKINANRNSDGRLEVYGIGMDDALWCIYQTKPSLGPWSSWVSLGGKIKDLSSALNSDGRLEVFGIGMDDSLWCTYQTKPHSGPWGAWVSLGGKVKKISANCNSDGRLEVFGIGMDDGLYCTYQTVPHAGPWAGWVSLGGKIKDLDSELNSDGRLEVFGIGMDDSLWCTYQTKPHSGPWAGWVSLGGKVKRISSSRNSDGRLEVFGIGMDDGLWCTYQTKPSSGPWATWVKLA